MDIKAFKKHRPVDTSDPGFSIPGARLRWLSGRVRETSSTSQMWVPLKKSRLPKDLVEHIEQCFPNAFADGETIRRGSGELILAYCTEDHAAKHRQELDFKAKEQQTRTRVMPKQEYVGKRDYAKIETYEGEASSIPRHFLKKDEE
jgi:hypothetical protein